jgi:hypothetical protein
MGVLYAHSCIALAVFTGTVQLISMPVFFLQRGKNEMKLFMLQNLDLD